MKKLSGKRIIAICLALVAVISCVFVVNALAFRRGIDPAEAKQSVVWVTATVQQSDGESVSTSMGSGTGWAIGKPGEPIQYIVTNGHVIADAYAKPKKDSSVKGKISVYFSAAENDYVMPEVIYYSAPEELDLAILKLPSATDKRTAMVFKDSDKVRQGDAVYAIGYPGLSSMAATNSRYDITDVTVTGGVISKRDVALSGCEWKGFQTDTTVNQGNSGGPMVDTKGRVIGVNTAGLHDQNASTGLSHDIGVNYAIMINQVIRVLRDEGLTYTMDTDKSWMLGVFLPVGILALIGAVVLWMLGGKSGAKEDGAKAGGVSGQTGAKKPVLRGVTGQYAGKVFDLAVMQQITMGRDPAVCNVIFDKDAPGVSGNHCMLRYDSTSDQFLLTDNGSSYGTFLGNGTKLGAAVPAYLKAGDMFYLADAKNRFVVDKE